MISDSITLFFKPGTINSPEEGVHQLVVSMLLRAFHDANKGDVDEVFFRSAWFDFLVSSLGIDTIWFMENIMKLYLAEDEKLTSQHALFKENDSVTRCECLELIYFNKHLIGSMVECPNCKRLYSVAVDGRLVYED